MSVIFRLAETLLTKAVGNTVDAGACVDSVGCCCGTAGHGQNCYGQCVKQPCRRC
jgi:hypothetical protein